MFTITGYKRCSASNLMACRGRPVEYGYVAEVILH